MLLHVSGPSTCIIGMLLHVLPLPETQVMNSLSGKLSHAPAGEQRLISDFLKGEPILLTYNS